MSQRKNIIALLRRFSAARDGSITILALVFFVMLIGIGGLGIDLGRLYNLNSQVEAYTDNAALAAAAELDGEFDALIRARRAAMGDSGIGPLLVDTQTFATDGLGDNLAVKKLIFLATLDDDPVPGAATPTEGDSVACTWENNAYTFSDDVADETECGKLARYVEVTAVPRTEAFYLLPIADVIGVLFGAEPAMASSTTTARSTAGFVRFVCNAPPFAICNPSESTTPPYGGPFTPVIGQLILLKTKSDGSAWAPGNYGFLDMAQDGDTPCGNPNQGTSYLRCVLGLVAPNTHCITGAVNFRTGQAVAAHVGLNMRFDIYEEPLKNKKSDPAFAPARNVTKGKVTNPNNCNMSAPPPSALTVCLPRDSVFGACGTAYSGSARFGTPGTANLAAYWSTNHGGSLPAALSGPGVTRYDVYHYENENNLITNKYGQNPKGENGNASCSTQTPVNNPARDRRMLVTAVVNCREHNVHGDADDVPVIAFTKMFMTEPVTTGDDVFAEMLGVADPGSADGIVHDFPVLYR